MDAAASTGARRLLRIFYALLVVFLYAPILVLALFSFNDGDPSFPLQ
jgi:ABC-type spermidine/putrescine transport system permease subunit II